MKLGDVKVKCFIHPDSIGVKVWEVYKAVEKESSSGHILKGEWYWARATPGIEPFTDEQAANDFADSIR